MLAVRVIEHAFSHPSQFQFSMLVVRVIEHAFSPFSVSVQHAGCTCSGGSGCPDGVRLLPDSGVPENA